MKSSFNFKSCMLYGIFALITAWYVIGIFSGYAESNKIKPQFLREYDAITPSMYAKQKSETNIHKPDVLMKGYSFSSSESPEIVASYYSSQLLKNGWRIISETQPSSIHKNLDKWNIVFCKKNNFQATLEYVEWDVKYGTPFSFHIKWAAHGCRKD